MSITYDFIRQGDFLLVNSCGSIESHEDMIEHAEKIIDAAQGLGQTKILIQSNNLSINLDAQEAALFANGIAQLQISLRGFRIATLISPNNAASRVFIEDVLTKRGIAYKNFVEKNEAVLWLLNS